LLVAQVVVLVLLDQLVLEVAVAQVVCYQEQLHLLQIFFTQLLSVLVVLVELLIAKELME
jgi:hypothetical protein